MTASAPGHLLDKPGPTHEYIGARRAAAAHSPIRLVAMNAPSATLTTLAAVLAMVSMPVAVAQAQGPPPREMNFADTIRVGRLPTGGCEWATVAGRMRPGKPGTTTRAGDPSETTCTVTVYNYTSGSASDAPALVGFTYVQDRKLPVPSNGVLNFADTFTVARRPDGNCDWSRTPVRPGPRGSTSYMGEVLTKDCWGVVYNVTFPPRDTTGMRTSTSTSISPHVWEGPDTLSGRGRQTRDVANVAITVIPRGARIAMMTITGDSLATVVVSPPGSPTGPQQYLFRKQGARWVAVSRP
jgi:hypothetical protein